MDNMDGIPPWWLDWSFYPSVLLVWLWSVALPGNDDNDYEIIMEDFLLVILTVPLVDKSLQMDLYKVHNLPTLHPKLNIQFTYQLEGKYLAIGKHGLYAALPSENDIEYAWQLQEACAWLNQALYPIERIEWCIYALFIKDSVQIAKFRPWWKQR